VQKLSDSEFTLRQTKIGKTLFDQECMQKTYQNPFFGNAEVHDKFLKFLNKRKP